MQRLREICGRHGLLLIFDEVITGFGRLGTMFAGHAFSVVSDMILFAKTVSNGAVPWSGAIVSRSIDDSLRQGPARLSKLMHGCTCSGHPRACAAALAMLDVIAQDNLLFRVQALARHVERAVHALVDAPGVVSIRHIGLAAGIERAPMPGAAGRRSAEAQAAAFKVGQLTRAPDAGRHPGAGATLYLHANRHRPHGRPAARRHPSPSHHDRNHTMKALVYAQPGGMQMQDRLMPALAAAEVVLKIKAVGIGGSDLHAWHGHDPRRLPGPVLGHGFVGAIVQSTAPCFEPGSR